MERNEKIPKTWIAVPIEDLGANEEYPIGDGDHGKIKPESYVTTGIPYIRVGDMDWGTLSTKNMVCIPKKIHDENPKSHLKPGDIIIAKTGATIGKCAIIPSNMKTANTTSSVGKVSINEGLTSSKWILYYFLSGEFKNNMWKVSNKTAQPGFNIINLKKFLIPLAPLNEQKRIVEKIDDLFSSIEKINELIIIFNKQIKNLSQKIIDVLTSKTDSEVKYQLGEIADIRGGATLGRKIKGKTIKLPYLRVANVQDGYLDLGKIKEIEIMEKEEDKWILESGDILLTEGGDRDKLGRGTVWNDQIQNCIHQNHIFRVRLDQSKFLPEFISMILRSSTSKQFFQSKGKQSVNLASINKTQLSSFSFFCPDYNLQKQRLEIIKQTLDKLCFFEHISKQSTIMISGLKHSILKQAFEGKLVPQDPNDEPASELLKRIKSN